MPHEDRIAGTATVLAELFQQTDRDRLQPLLAQARFRTFREGELLLAEGDKAHEVFVLWSGRLHVYTHQPDGHWAGAGSIDEPGRLVGEQALLGDRRFRNATVVALTDGELVALPGQLFRALIATDAHARRQLGDRVSLQTRQRLLGIARTLADLGELPVDTSSRQLLPGEPLFAAGEPADTGYLVVSGELALYPEGSAQSLERVGPGLPVGLEAAANGGVHRSTCRAVSASEVLSLDHGLINALKRQRSGLGAMLFGWSQLQPVSQTGIRRRFLSTERGESCLITDFSNRSGQQVRIRHFPALALTEAVAGQAGQVPTRQLIGSDRVMLLISDDPSQRLLGITSPPDWPGLPDAMGALLRGDSLSGMQVDAFLASGQFLLEDAAVRAAGGSELVCACTRTSARDLRNAARTCSRVEQLIERTGAGSVCGGCLNRLAAFLGQDSTTLCRLETRPLALDSLRARLRPLPPGRLPTPRPGQHVQIEALIDGRWTGRPYTLTDWSEGTYELGVKIEDQGFFSNWIREAEPGVLLRVGNPSGVVCPAPDDPRPLVYLVAGIGVTPAVAATRHLSGHRRISVIYSYRSEPQAAYLPLLQAAAADGHIQLQTHDSSRLGRMEPESLLRNPLLQGPCELVICGPSAFNDAMAAALSTTPGVDARVESFDHPQRGEGPTPLPRSWRLPGFQPRCPAEQYARVDQPLPPAEEARQFLQDYFQSERPEDCPKQRVEAVLTELAETGRWTMQPEELHHAARLAWRNAERCIGRLYWRGLHLHDCRHLEYNREIAEALFEHLRFAFNGGDLRPAISIFDPGTRDRPGARIWNPQLLRYAGLRLRSGKQIGDPAQNALTRKIMALGWEPEGSDFDLLPLVLQRPGEAPEWFELPADCRQEVSLSHPRHAWLETLGLRWYAVPAVSEMALDAGGVLYRLAPFNGWYLNTEIAARNLTDSNRYNLLPRLAEQMGLDIRDERTLWRDKALIMLNEALIQSFDRAGVRIADHHSACHEFLEFCRSEQSQGREVYGDWTWLVPPVSSSTTALYQEPFENQRIKPAYVGQAAIWKND